MLREIVLLFAAIVLVNGHARLRDPPGRASANQLGFTNVPAYYNDNQMNCGGYGKIVELKGACGICGDPADANPRESERPNGKLATNTIVRTYKSGATIDAAVDMVGNHRGQFWFRLCPATSDNVEVTQACLNSHTLKIVEAPSWGALTNATTWDIHGAEHSNDNMTWKFKVQLPAGLTCNRCVFQWDWMTNNRPGSQYQEVFRGCADVKIE